MATKNDWIVANISNPNLDLYDLTTIGDINTENTQFLSKDEYLKSNFIRNNPAFQDESGNFSEGKFDMFYKQQAARWGEFQEDQFPKGLKLDYFDTRRTKDTAVKSMDFDIGPEYDPKNGRFNANPDRVKIGIEGWNTTSARTQSEKEIAESQRIFNPKTGVFENETPEDSALFGSPVNFIKSLFEDPLVLAVYDKDEVDDYGIQHRKGEKKLNERGTYYTERLNGRSPLGKEVISVADLITKEGSAINKIDFMDSDDLQKSVPGVIAKNVAKIAPLFMGPAVGGIYATALIAREMSKALPMLYGVGANLFGSESETPEWINTLGAKGESLTSGNSVYASEHMFSFENFASLAADVAVQWAQQKQIAKAIQYLGDNSQLVAAEKRAKALFDSKSTGKLAGLAQVDPALVAAGMKAEDAWKTTALGRICLQKAYEPVKAAVQAKSRLGADLALAYMAIVSNTDVYEDMIAKGATQKEAAWVTLASTAGMFSVDRFLGLGEMFFDELTAESVKESRAVLKKEIAEVVDDIYKSGKKQTQKGIWNKAAGLGKKLGNALSDYWDNVKHHNLGGLGKAIGEGLEEVSEELTTDIAKSMYAALGDAGFYEASVKNPVDWDTALQRYAMNFFGGAIGGGIFYAKEKFSTRFDPRQDRDMVDLIRDNKAEDLRREIIQLRDRGRVGDTTLSGVDYTREEGTDKVTWLSTDDKAKSQNNLIADRIIDKINALEATIVGNNANLSDDALFENMVLGEARYQQYKNASYVTGYYKEFKKRLEDLVSAEQALKAAQKTSDGNPASPETATDAEERNNPSADLRERNIANLQEKATKAKAALDDFLSGDTALEYTRKLNFILDPVLNSAFLDLDFNDWVENHADFDYTNPEEFDMQKWIDLQKGYLEHVKEVMSSDAVDKAFAAYTVLEQSVLAPTMEQAEASKVYADALTKLDQLYKLNDEATGFALSASTFFREHPIWTYNSRLVDESGVEESDEAYNSRLLSGTPELDMARAQRVQRVADLNRQRYQEYVNQFTSILEPLGFKVDAAAARNILQSIGARVSDIIAEESKYGRIDAETGQLFGFEDYIDLAQQLNDDLSNVEDIRKLMLTRYYDLTSQRAKTALDAIDQTARSTIRVDLAEFTGRAKDVEALTGMDEEDVPVTIANINAMATSNPLVQYYLSSNPLATKEDLVKFVTFLKKDANNLADDLGTNPEGMGTVEEVKTQLLSNPITSTYFAQYLLNNEVNTYEDIKKFSKVLETEINETILRNVLPDYIVNETVGVKDVLSRYVKREGFDVTVAQLLSALQNPNSYEYKFFANMNGEMPSRIIAALMGSDLNFGHDVPVAALTGQVDLDESNASTTMKAQAKSVSNYLDTTVQRTKTNPIFTFYGKLKTELHSPLEQILTAVATEISPEGEKLNIPQILDGVYKSYINADTQGAFMLESAQAKSLETAMKALKMVQAFIYAASTSADGNNYFGQNSQINAFAANHAKSLVKEWKPLPEIDEHYATLLMQEQDKLHKEMKLWQIISDRNAMNKLGRLVEVEGVLNKVRYDALKKVSGTFTIDDKEFSVAEGLEDMNPLGEGRAEQLGQVYEAEQTVYDNLRKISKETGKTVEELLSNPDVVLSFVANQSELKKQQTASLTKSLSKLSTYDKALYVLSLLSDNPAEYYKFLRGEVEANGKLPEDKQIAPLTVQQSASRLAQAAHTKAYKAGFKTLAALSETKRTITPNVVHIDGRAGAGKTEVILKSVRNRYSDEAALVIGPTSSQAIKLQNSLNEATSYTIDPSDPNNIFTLLLGSTVTGTIQSDIDKAVALLYKKINEPKNQKLAEQGVPLEFRESTTYFDLVYYNENGEYGTRVELHLDKLKFNDAFNQTLVFIDEGAHLNSVQIALLDAYAEKVGGTVYIASDSNQDGYFNPPLENVGPTAIFATRTFKQTESLRSSNIQMQENGNKSSDLLDIVEDVFNSGGGVAEGELLQRLPNDLKQMHYRVYDGDDDINGYLFGANTEKVITTLKRVQDEKAAKGEAVTFGFIGSESSPTYQAFKSAGINVSPALTERREPGKPFMQGQEFDYVFIDRLDLPSTLTPEYNSVVTFFRRFNTLATRGKVASIFADDLTRFFGEQTKDSQKSEGFSIKGQIAKFKEDYEDSLRKLKLKETVEEETPAESPAPAPAPAPTPAPEPEVVEGGEEVIVNVGEEIPAELTPEVTPEVLTVKADEVKEELKEFEAEPETPKEVATDAAAFDEVIGKMMVEANTVAPVISLETEGGREGTWLPYDTSKETSSGHAVRRNLQCFFTTDNASEGISSYADKQKAQQILHSIQSYILFGGNILPETAAYFRADWTKVKLQLEIRPKTDTDYFGVGTDLKQTFIKKGGKQYVIAVVARLDGVQAQNAAGETAYTFDAVFDICQMTDPSALNTKTRQTEIISNIEKKIKQIDSKLERDDLPDATRRALTEQKTRLNALAVNLPTVATEYDKLITETLAKNPGGKTIDLPAKAITFHKTTRLVSHAPRRLGTMVSIANIENNVRVESGSHEGEYVEDFDSFMHQDSRKVVSDVYIVGKQSSTLTGVVDESIFGKAVVFVSNNTNLSKDELAERYIQQKLNPDIHTPEVRMVILDNHGLSFSEVVYNRIAESVSESSEGKLGKRWRTDVLGLRMFTALWNWRAGLIGFTKAYEAWKAKYGYSQAQVNNILRAEYEVFEESKAKGETVETTLQRTGFKYNKTFGSQVVTEEDLKRLAEFNFEFCKDIPIFRLGLDFSKDASGQSYGGYIRPFKVDKNSSIYKTKKSGDSVNLFAISPEYATKYLKILDVILDQLTETPDAWTAFGGTKPPKSLGVKLLHGTDEGARAGQPFNKDEYISKSAQKRNLSGMIRTVNKRVVLQEKNEAGEVVSRVEIDPNSVFSFFPKALAAIVKNVKGYQMRGGSSSGLISIGTVSRVNGEDVSDYFNFDIALLFGPDMLERTSTSDHTILNLFNLCFHGTTQSLEEWKTKKKGEKLKRPYLEDAVAKFGFFIDPDLDYDTDKSHNIRPTKAGGAGYTFLKCRTSPAYFDVNVEARPGGVALDLEYIKAALQGRVIEETPETPVGPVAPTTETLLFSSTIEDATERAAFLEAVANDIVSDSKEGYAEFVKIKVANDLNNVFSGHIEGQEATDIINNQLKKQNTKFEVENVVKNGETLVFRNSDGKEGTIEKSVDGDGDITLIINVRNETSHEAEATPKLDELEGKFREVLQDVEDNRVQALLQASSKDLRITLMTDPEAFGYLQQAINSLSPEGKLVIYSFLDELNSC